MTTVFTDPDRYTDMYAWHREVAELRMRSPIHRITADGFDPFWAVIGHEEVMEVERRPELFQNAPQPWLINQADLRAQREAGPAPRTLIHMDGADHAAYRRLGNDWFRPGSLARLQTRLDRLAQDALDRLAELDGRCDFAVDVAMPYPLKVILEIMGLPEEEYPRVIALTQDFFARDGDAQVLQNMFGYMYALTAARRAVPTDDLASAVSNGLVHGEPIPEVEATSYHMMVATAGYESTAKALTGGLHALITHPDQLDRLRRNPELIDGAVDEMIRYASPLRHMMRTATADTEVGGTPIAAGDWLLLSYPAANLDPKKFPDPVAFDVTRPNAGSHLAFGFGPHHCLGAALARMEMRTLFRALIPRLAAVNLAGDAALTDTTFIGGFKSLPITYRLS
ncbi:cytochrome P450 [Catenuloplanes atrovinosus]|uniref:Cytochrome P450 n=1 Tax=Catenuloplanes atrovinosus TaxID=137266 RepID=A0AAE3YL16_9ACTN|nr:cytochrome P450 [Catenuloplanes atrovinosus]MDR7274246.1 cytochrome P450 [Catenuloplanes atrovinosus]